MMRTLLLDFAADSRATHVRDQYMFGSALLLKPVSDVGATSRSVYLPAGNTWYDFWTGQPSHGGQTIDASAVTDRLPLYVRGGSIVPLGPIARYAEKSADSIELRVYPGANGAFTLYDCENDDHHHKSSRAAAIPLTWSDAKKMLTIGVRSGAFPGMLESRKFDVVFVAAGHGVGIATTATVDQTVTYSGGPLEVVAR